MVSISLSPMAGGPCRPAGEKTPPTATLLIEYSISTPPLGGVFQCSWLHAQPGCGWRDILGDGQLGARHRRSPELPRAVHNYLWIVIAAGEQGKTDLTPQPRWHDHDYLGAGPVAKTERPANDLVEFVEKV